MPEWEQYYLFRRMVASAELHTRASDGGEWNGNQIHVVRRLRGEHVPGDFAQRNKYERCQGNCITEHNAYFEREQRQENIVQQNGGERNDDIRHRHFLCHIPAVESLLPVVGRDYEAAKRHL